MNQTSVDHIKTHHQYINSNIFNSSRFYIDPQDATFIFDGHNGVIHRVPLHLQNYLMNRTEGINLSYIDIQYFNDIINKQKGDPYSIDTWSNIGIKLNIDKRCNLNCVYCFVDKARDLSIDRAKISKLIDQLLITYAEREQLNFVYSLTSEPLYDIELFEFTFESILKSMETNGKKWSFSFITNGTLLNDRILSVLNKTCWSFNSALFTITDFKSESAIDKICKSLHKLDPNFKNKHNYGIDWLNYFIEYNTCFYSKCKSSLNIRWSKNQIYYRNIIDTLSSISYEEMDSRQRCDIQVINRLLINELSDEIIGNKQFDFSPKITISLDGEKENHDLNRIFKDGNGSHQKVIQNIEILKKHNFSINIICVISPKNCDLLELTRYFQSIGVCSVVFSIVAPNSSVGFTEISINEYLGNLEFFLDKVYSDACNNLYDIIYITSKDSIWSLFRQLIKKELRDTKCSFGKCEISIDIDGNIFPCDAFMSDEKYCIGNIFEKQPRKINCKNVDCILECSTCWAKYICGGTCYRANHYSNGDINRISKVDCIRMKNSIIIMLNFIKNIFLNKDLGKKTLQKILEIIS